MPLQKRVNRPERKKGYFSSKEGGGYTERCQYEVLLTKFNQVVNLIEITGNKIKWKLEDFLNVEHLTESQPEMWILYILSSKSQHESY